MADVAIESTVTDTIPSEVTCKVVVVGSGVAGICAGIRLREEGIEDFVILERRHEVGGTWRDHTYPGLTIDIPSLTYSFSFEQKRDWSSMWAPGPEMLGYLRHCVEKYEVGPHFRFGQEVLDATYDAGRNAWLTRVADGTVYVSQYLINGSGFLNVPRSPDIKGIETFKGTMLHSSQWSGDVDLTGKRVALIGTGATAIQLAPQIAPALAKLHVFQRTPIWLLPKPPLRFPRLMHRAFAIVPGLQRSVRLLTAGFMDLVFFRTWTNYRHVRKFAHMMERISKWHVRRQVDDADLHDKLIPNYSWGCKRPSFSQDFYPMFNAQNVELVTDSIDHVTENGIVTTDGVERQVDVLLCATGYQPFEKGTLPTYPVYGIDGLELGDYWAENRFQAFKGIAVHGFPNYFLVFGPYSIVSSSYVAMAELAMRNIIGWIKEADRQHANYVEVKPDAQRADFDEMIRRKEKSIFVLGNCTTSNSYYYDRRGDVPTFRQSNHPVTWWKTRKPTLESFDVRHKDVDAPEGKLGRAGSTARR